MVKDLKAGPKAAHSSTLTEAEVAMVVAFRQHTLLTLDDCLWEFFEHQLKAVGYRIHTTLTDNGIQFADQPRNRNTAWSRQMRFEMICEANAIEHRPTKPNHLWTNDHVERMNRTIKEAIVKRFHYDSHEQLRKHLTDFMAAYNFAPRLKTLSGLTPYEYIAKIWTSQP